MSATFLLLVALTGVLIYLIRPVVRQVQLGARQAVCRARAAELVSALYQYRNDNQRFPPCYTVDSQGKPLHSWRVLLLPYLGPQAQAIHAQLRLDEPWNSPHNLAWANQAPDVFVCPDDQRFAAGDTSFCAIVGDRYAFRPGVGISVEEITDDPSSTVLLIEASHSGINWMSPQDITAADLAQGLNSQLPGSPGSHHVGRGVTVGTAEGQGKIIADHLSPDDLHRMATIGGGEFVATSLSQPR
jgi:hypothetical protein